MALLDARASPILTISSRAVRSFLPRAMPAMARANYGRELVAAASLPFLLAAVEGGIIGVLVKNGFEGVVPARRLNYVVAALTAAPAFAYVTSFLWVRAAHGRRKVAAINATLLLMGTLVISIALLPRSETGLYLTAAAVFGARVAWAGYITLRSTVWGVNYPRASRGRLTGKLATVQVLTVAALGMLMGSAMDLHPEAYRVTMPLGAAAAMVGVAAWGRVRVRGERGVLRRERADAGRDRPSFNPLSVWRVLRADRRYAAFMLCMFLLGMGNLMLEAPLVITLRERFGLGYLGGILSTTTLPYVMMPVSIPFWARLLDRGHVVRFRSIHAWFFVASTTLILVASLTGALWLLVVAVVVEGLAFGGGVLAWNLGHLDFAPPHRSAQYMGVHVTLTGVRGLIAPFIGVALYEWFEHPARDGVARASAPGGGPWVFGVCLLFSVAGAAGFVALARAMGGNGPASGQDRGNNERGGP